MGATGTYIVYGFCDKSKGFNIAQAYKSKSAAKKRAEKMIESGAYEKVSMYLKNAVYDGENLLLLNVWTV